MMTGLRCASIALLVGLATAAPLQPRFTTCESYYNSAPGIERLNISSVYANLVPGSTASQLGLPGNGLDVLRVDLIGTLGQQLVGYDNGTNKLATLFTETTVGGIEVYRSTSWVCNSLFPANLTTPYVPFETAYCPLPAGPFALNVSIPLSRSYALTTLNTQIRIVDTSFAANTLSCVNVSFTPYDRNDWVYDLLLWLPVAILVGFWAVSWGARFAAGWVVGSGVAEYGTKDQHGDTRDKELDKAGRREARMRKWGTMIVSGLSGERLSVSSALLRFVTPGLREIIHHIQFCTILVMVAVSWPEFAYPIAARLAWADLVWNNTLTLGGVPTRVVSGPTNTTLPPAFSPQMTDSRYPLYLDATAANHLLDLHSSSPGLESFATTVGLRPQDLFGLCIAIFLLIAATVIFISLVFWGTHALVEAVSQDRTRSASGAGTSAASKRLSFGSTPSMSILADKAFDRSNPTSPGLELTQNPLAATSSQNQLATSRTRRSSKLRRIWWRFRPKGEAGAFHATTLYGNLLRLILIFHLPITAFSMYQLALGSRASIVSRVFAALALVFISVLIPAGVLWKVYKTPGGKLYDATRTLLSLGTMYNHYVMDKQMFRAFPIGASLITGIVIGAGQASGIAQGAILVVIELCMLVLPAVWYPWGDGASMGAPSIFLGVIRVISVLLVMLMSPVFTMTENTLTWLAYAVILLNTIVFLFFLFMLLTKILEGLIRLGGGVHFDESTHPLDGGLFAAIADLDCLNGVTGGKAAARRRRKRGSRQLQRNVSAAGSLTTQQMLDRHSQGVPRVSPESSFLFAPPMPRLSQGYFPAQPPLGPPPLERHSSDSRNEDHHDRIMDAWKPRPRSGEYVQPGTYAPTVGSPIRQDSASISEVLDPNPGRSFSVVRGGRADMSNPYDVQPGSEVEELHEVKRARSPSLTPVVATISHPGRVSFSRGYSSQAVVEDGETSSQGHSSQQNFVPSNLYNPPTGAAYASNSFARLPPSPSAPAALSQTQVKRLSGNPLDPVEHVPLRPPVMTLPKRRSLNDLKSAEVDSAASDYSDSPDSKKWDSRDRTRKGKHKPKQRSKTGRGWFSREEDTGSESLSDDEPGPSRNKSRAKQKKGFKESPLATNMLADEMGGVPGDESTGGAETSSRTPGWRRLFGRSKGSAIAGDDEEEERAKDENRARKAALANESGALFVGVESPVKSRLKPKSRHSASIPLNDTGGSSGKKSFVVHRQRGLADSATATPSGSSYTSIPSINVAGTGMSGPSHLSPSIGANEPGDRSFKVKRLVKLVTPHPISAGSVPGSTKASPHVAQFDSDLSGNGSAFTKASYPPLPSHSARAAASMDIDREGGKKGFRILRPAQPARRSMDAGRGEGVISLDSDHEEQRSTAHRRTESTPMAHASGGHMGGFSPVSTSQSAPRLDLPIASDAAFTDDTFTSAQYGASYGTPPVAYHTAANGRRGSGSPERPARNPRRQSIESQRRYSGNTGRQSLSLPGQGGSGDDGDRPLSVGKAL